jgi:hypothetical protein
MQLKQIPPIGNRPIGRHDVRGIRRPVLKILKYRLAVGRTVDIAFETSASPLSTARLLAFNDRAIKFTEVDPLTQLGAKP